MGLYTGGLIYGWAYIRNGESGAYIRCGLYSVGLIFGGAYIRRFTIATERDKRQNFENVMFVFGKCKKYPWALSKKAPSEIQCVVF